MGFELFRARVRRGFRRGAHKRARETSALTGQAPLNLPWSIARSYSSGDCFVPVRPVNTTKLKGAKQVGNLGDECLQFILLRGWQHRKPSQVADVLRISSHTMRSSQKLAYQGAARFLTSKIIMAIRVPGRRRSNRYLCRFHGEQFMTPEGADDQCWAQVFEF